MGSAELKRTSEGSRVGMPVPAAANVMNNGIHKGANRS